MKAKNFLLQTICCVLIFSTTCNAQYNYLPTKTVDSSDTYFGVTYKDPYRWLENIKTPEVEKWFKQQATYTDSILNTLNGRESLIAEWKKLDKLQPANYNTFRFENGRLFYRKTMPGENVGKIFYRQGENGTEHFLFDPTTYIPGKTLSVQRIEPSYDGKKLAISYTEQGAEIPTIKIMDVDTRKFLSDSLYNASIISWTFDNKSFFYRWAKSADTKVPTALLNHKVKLHTLGKDNSNDIDYFSNTRYPELHIAPDVYPYVFLDEDSKNYIFSGVSTAQPEKKMYYAPIQEMNAPHIKWNVLCTPADKLVRDMVRKGDNIYAITYNNNKNNKVIVTSLKHPDWNNAVSIAAGKPDRIIETISYCKDYLLITYSDGINNYLSKYNFTTKKTSAIKLPFTGTAYISADDTKTNDCFVGITSWNKPYSEFNYNPTTDVFTPGNFNKPANYPAAYKDLVVEEVQVKGHDGVMIPLTIIHKKDTKLDGSNICLIKGYGAYGFSMIPNFDEIQNALAVRNVVVAIAHVRGGGEKGEAWRKGGYKTTKPNTWKDYNSCAEYLIANGYTSPKKLACEGGSAGGLLISRAITERPDLYAAAICEVGIVNAMRFEFTPNGPANIPEFGTVKDSIESRALYEMDGVQHVVKDTKYPAVICVTGWNDHRVVPWQPGKFAAALQNASSSGKPVLLKVNYDNGHFTEDRNVTFADVADQYAFILWQCGNKDFQPKK